MRVELVEKVTSGTTLQLIKRPTPISHTEQVIEFTLAKPETNTFLCMIIPIEEFKDMIRGLGL